MSVMTTMEAGTSDTAVNIMVLELTVTAMAVDAADITQYRLQGKCAGLWDCTALKEGNMHERVKERPLSKDELYKTEATVGQLGTQDISILFLRIIQNWGFTAINRGDRQELGKCSWRKSATVVLSKLSVFAQAGWLVFDTIMAEKRRHTLNSLW